MKHKLRRWFALCKFSRTLAKQPLMIVIQDFLLLYSKFFYLVLITVHSHFSSINTTSANAFAFVRYLTGLIKYPWFTVLLAATWWHSQHQNCELTSRISGSTHLGNQKLWLRAAEKTSASSGDVLLLFCDASFKGTQLGCCQLWAVNLQDSCGNNHMWHSLYKLDNPRQPKTTKTARRNPSCSAQ